MSDLALPALPELPLPPQGYLRIAMSGGPGGGKTTAADMFRREIGDSVVVVPEAATMLFSGGFPRSESPQAIRAVQRAIFHVQRNLEDVQLALYPDRILLCDRGTIDGAAYWPGKQDEFFEMMGTTLERELSRYNAVLFFESAAVGNLGIEGGNPTRTETLQEARDLDSKLRLLWGQHPNCFYIPHNPSFFKKITFSLALLENLVSAFVRDHDARIARRTAEIETLVSPTKEDS